MSSERLFGRFAVVLVLACVTVVAATVLAARSPAVRTYFGLRPPPAYAVGASIDLPDRLYRSSPHTLFIFVRSSCAACQAAKPVLAALAPRLRQTPTDIVMIISGAHAGDEAVYAHDLGVDAAHLVALDLSGLRVKLLPTVVLVNRSGQVLYSVEGVPTAVDQQRFLQAAAALGPTA